MVTRPHAVRDLILTYLYVAGEPILIRQILRHMQAYRISEGATRTQLWRLCQAGLVERVGVGEYRVAPARMSWKQS